MSNERATLVGQSISSNARLSYYNLVCRCTLSKPYSVPDRYLYLKDAKQYRIRLNSSVTVIPELDYPDISAEKDLLAAVFAAAIG